jgi:hypothetical protein
MQAIVLAGGYATRLRPTSLSMSKHLVPLANRPVLGWVLSQIAEAGVREVFIVVGLHNREQIAEYVGDGSRFGLSVVYLLQERPLGLAHAVSLAERRVSGPLPRVPRFWGIVDLLDKDGRLILRMRDGCLLDIDSFDPVILAETWLHEIYYLGFDLTSWFVLDIGAFVGDTALYYAKRGAFVVAVEPLPNNYETMMKILGLNPDLKPKIVPINVAVAGKDGFMDVKYSGGIDGGASAYTQAGSLGLGSDL